MSHATRVYGVAEENVKHLRHRVAFHPILATVHLDWKKNVGTSKAPIIRPNEYRPEEK